MELGHREGPCTLYRMGLGRLDVHHLCVYDVHPHPLTHPLQPARQVPKLADLPHLRHMPDTNLTIAHVLAVRSAGFIVRDYKMLF